MSTFNDSITNPAAKFVRSEVRKVGDLQISSLDGAVSDKLHDSREVSLSTLDK